MRLRKACEHGRYERHFVTFYNMEQWSCPGGEFLPEGAIVIEKVDGQWPGWAVEGLSDPPLYELSPKALALLEAGGRLSMPTKPRYILDALASQVGEKPICGDSQHRHIGACELYTYQVGESE